MSITSGNGHPTHYQLPEPDPAMTPQEVVQLVLHALQNNNDPCEDCGIQTTFNFASPANRAVTGPLQRFTAMIHNPEYSPLLNFEHCEVDSMIIGADLAHAEQQVSVFDVEGNHFTYVFMLSKQPGPAWQDCWMTDAVMRLE